MQNSMLAIMAAIVKELGLFPTGSDDKTEGYYLQQMTKDERFPRRGGGYYSAPRARGLGMSSPSTRAAMGARPMAVALAPFETLTPGF